MVSRQIGLGTHGYGYLFAGIGAGGLAGTALASRASRSSHPRWILAAALAAVGLPTALLAVAQWPAVAILLAGLTGTGALLVEILTDTCLQRALDEDVLGRACAATGVRAGGRPGGSAGWRAGRDGAGRLGPAGRRVADQAGYCHAADRRVVDRAGAGGRAGAVICGYGMPRHGADMSGRRLRHGWWPGSRW